MAGGEIGARIRRTRKALHPTMRGADLARLIDVTPQRLNNWESGLHDPTPELLPRIAAALGARLEFLTSGEGAMAPPPAKVPNPVISLVDKPVLPMLRGGATTPWERAPYLKMRLVESGSAPCWSFEVTSTALWPIAKPKDVLTFEARERVVSGDVVHAIVAGADEIGIARRSGDGWELAYPEGRADPLPLSRGEVQGVAVQHTERFSGGRTRITLYPDAMNADFPLG